LKRVNIYTKDCRFPGLVCLYQGMILQKALFMAMQLWQMQQSEPAASHSLVILTPAAEIMQEMQEMISQEKAIFVQAEEEIASAGMVLGASMAGVKAMTSTSGPGFDLMTEMMGLASSAEIPQKMPPFN